MRKLPLVLALSLALSSFAFAHPGGTNGDGGHMDRSTGKYHYHHGYPAHDHENGVCPYDFKDKTGDSSGQSSGSSGGGTSAIYYRSTSNVNMRSSASSSSSILQTIPEGSTLKYMNGHSGNWYRVSYAGITGWVYGDYIVKRAAPVTAKPTLRPTATVAANPVKSSPSKDKAKKSKFLSYLPDIIAPFAVFLGSLLVFFLFMFFCNR